MVAMLGVLDNQVTLERGSGGKLWLFVPKAGKLGGLSCLRYAGICGCDCDGDEMYVAAPDHDG